MEKPLKVEVGQRYANGNGEITVRRRIASLQAWAYCEDGKVDNPGKLDTWMHDGECCWFCDDWFKTATYLGGPTPTESGRAPAPAVQVGQRYWQTGSENPGWFDVIETPWSKNPEMFLVRWDDGGEGAVRFSELPQYRLDSGSTATVMGERDWSKWLPRAELPNTGPKVFKVGQVWACITDYTGAGVVRITAVSPSGGVADTDDLAGGMRARWRPMPDSPNSRHSVLVADVGCEPTPPEILYARPPRKAASEAADSEQPITRALDPAVPRKPAAGPPAGTDGQRRLSTPAREVFAGGAWLPYEKLHDPDPFDRYKRRRENGVEVAMVEPRGYDGISFAEHKRRDRCTRAGTDGHEYQAAKEPPSPLETCHVPGDTPAQARAYYTPSRDGR